MKFLVTCLFLLLISCAPRVYTAWADGFAAMHALREELSVNNEIVEIVNHGGVYEIRYKDKKVKKDPEFELEN